MTKENDTTASDWFARISRGDLDENTRQAYEQWLDADGQNRKAMAECELLASAFDCLAGDQAIRQMQREAMITEPLTHEQTNCSPRWFNFSFLAGGSAIAAALATLVLVFTPQEFNHVYQTQIGQQAQVALPDASTIHMNTNTKIQVAYGKGKRQVELRQGEAVFSVQHVDNAPFYVSAGEIQVRVVGTRFNVLVQKQRVSVSVIEGKVDVSTPHVAKPSRTSLIPGESAVYAETNVLTTQKDEREIKRVTAWQSGLLEFDGWQLSTAIDEHNRYSDIKIVLEAPELAEVQMSGVFKIGDTDSFSSALEQTLPVKLLQKEGYLSLQSIK